MKCNLLNRIIELETGKARAESVIHLVDSQDPDAIEAGPATGAEQEQDENSAIA